MISWVFSCTCRGEFIKYIYFTVADVRDLGWEDKGTGEGDEDNINDKQTKRENGTNLSDLTRVQDEQDKI